MGMRQSRIHLPVVVLAAVALGGCIGPVTEPSFISPSFNGSEIDTIYLMPAVEYAAEAAPDLDGCIWKGARSHFGIKGYRCIRLQEESLVHNIRRGDFSEPNTAVLANVGPREARWLLFFVFHEEKGDTRTSQALA